MFGREHRLDRAGRDHAPFGKDRDAVADRVQAVEVVGHHEHAQAQGLLQRADEFVEIGGADRVEA
jgi:hypothetical protein